MKKENPRYGKKECTRAVLAMVLVGMFTLTAVTWVGIGSGGGDGTRSGEDLVLELHFNEGSGSTVYDSSGNGNDGTINGASWTNGKYGKALNFDGTGDYVEIPHTDQFNFPNSFTIGAWINFNEGGGINPKIFSKDSMSDGVIFHTQGNGNERLLEFGIQGFTPWYVQSSSKIFAAEWYFVVGIYNSQENKFQIFINGILDNETSVTGTPIYSSNSAYIGKRRASDLDGFNGIIDEIYIYNRALNAEEIKDHYEAFYLNVWTDVTIYRPGDQVTLTARYTGENASTVTFEVADPDDTKILVKTEDIIWEPGEFTKYAGNPVLDHGNPGSWDSKDVGSPSVINSYENNYLMWYDGYDGSTAMKIGYATSTNGTTWVKYPNNPILNIGSQGEWDDGGVRGNTVIYNDGLFHMWYFNYDNNARIGYAYSSDGINWTKYSDNPVLEGGGNNGWDDESVEYPEVIYSNGLFRMWYSGRDTTDKYRIGYATSADGINWTKSSSNPVLDLGSVGEWDNYYVHSPTVIFDGGSYHMWYSGNDASTYRIGYATSPDGITWIKSENNPVLDIGTSGSWDDVHIASPEVIREESVYKMWCGGQKHMVGGLIGYATAPAPRTATTTFTLPSDAPTGTYTVYASCIDATANTTFKVIAPGITVGDVIIPASINPGDSVDFDIYINNGLTESQDILVVLQVMNPNDEPLAPIYEYVTVNALTTKLVTLTFSLPSDSPLGTYFAQTQVLTEFPRNGGYAIDYRNDNFEVT
ncbi:MAG: hypothetical protein JSW28_02755 [Thermoplasmata archaeon]|nr:MAG: hypothetical protein JSW28_02755 [Thermoplasmata archaeon]